MAGIRELGTEVREGREDEKMETHQGPTTSFKHIFVHIFNDWKTSN